MVAGFLVRRRLPFQRWDAEKEKLYWEHNSGKALLQSSVNDADLITDWIYFYQTATSHDAGLLPSWLRRVQLASCVCGSFAWLVIASDARAMNWLRWCVMWIVVGIVGVLVFLLFTLPREFFSCLRRNEVGDYHNVRSIESCVEGCEWSLQSLIVRVRSSFETGFRFASGAVLLLGVLLEDVPQIVVTFLIEDVIRSDDLRGTNSSGAAQINLSFAVLDICLKLAEAYDLRNDVVKAGDAAVVTLRGHKDGVSALVPAGGSRFVSGADDGTWRVWDAVEGKAVGLPATHPSSKRARVSDVLVLDGKRVVTTYNHVAHPCDQTMVFDLESGEIVNSLSHDTGSAMAAVAAPDGASFLTVGSDQTLRQYSASTLESIKEIPSIIQEHTSHRVSLAFLDDNTFVVGPRDDRMLSIWSLRGSGPHPLDSHGKVRCVEVTAPASLLAGMGNGTIKRWDMGRRKLMQIFEGHRRRVESLARIDDAHFASGSSDRTARIWRVASGECLRILSGHTDSVKAIAYLPDKKLIVTGSDDKSIKVWTVDDCISGGEEDEVEADCERQEAGKK